MKVLTEAQKRYQAYLQSPHWQERRQRILTRAGDHCERCGRFGGLNPHGNHRDRELVWCGREDCEFCAFYFDTEGQRNDCELQQLEIHHRTYARRGYELDRDLAALCWGCHEDTWDTDVWTSDTLFEAPAEVIEESPF